MAPLTESGDMSLNWAEYFLSGSYAQDERALDFVFDMTETYGSDPMAALLSFPPLSECPNVRADV
jgi:hypothetical protein